MRYRRWSGNKQDQYIACQCHRHGMVIAIKQASRIASLSIVRVDVCHTSWFHHHYRAITPGAMAPGFDAMVKLENREFLMHNAVSAYHFPMIAIVRSSPTIRHSFLMSTAPFRSRSSRIHLIMSLADDICGECGLAHNIVFGWFALHGVSLQVRNIISPDEMS